MYRSLRSRGLCSDGMRCIKPLAPSRNETNSSRVNGGADGAILGICAEGGHDQAGFRFPLWRPAARACIIRVCSTSEGNEIPASGALPLLQAVAQHSQSLTIAEGAAGATQPSPANIFQER